MTLKLQTGRPAVDAGGGCCRIFISWTLARRVLLNTFDAAELVGTQRGRVGETLAAMALDDGRWFHLLNSNREVADLFDDGK